MTEPKPGMHVEQKFKGVIATAYGTAWNRAMYTDIPYSKEIFNALLKIFPEFKKKKDDDKTPHFEARFLMINDILDKEQAKQILDVASGFLPRGMTRAQDPSVTYVELDLPPQIEIKQKVLDDLKNQSIIPSLPNLYLEAGSATKSADLERAARHFDPNKPIVVICEGLLRYFDKEQIAQTARGIHALLEKFGGMWITPDVGIGKYDPNSLHWSGVNKTKGRFETIEKAKEFFDDLGFAAEVHAYDDELKNRLVAPKRIGLSKNEVDKYLDPKTRIFFIIRLK